MTSTADDTTRTRMVMSGKRCWAEGAGAEVALVAAEVAAEFRAERRRDTSALGTSPSDDMGTGSGFWEGGGLLVAMVAFRSRGITAAQCGCVLRRKSRKATRETGPRPRRHREGALKRPLRLRRGEGAQNSKVFWGQTIKTSAAGTASWGVENTCPRRTGCSPLPALVQ